MSIDARINKIARELMIELGEEVFRSNNGCKEAVISSMEDSPDNLAKMIDHTLLKADATFNEIERLCAEAKENGFASVCINPGYVRLASRLLGEDEVKAWTIKKETIARNAAGKIHSDIERGFIRAEVIAYDDLKELGSMAAVREQGLFRLEGKDYLVKDGDIVHFRFNV